ncbi:MAG: GNAT family N-acetyltransferase [Methanosphaera stadtmanae]|nr:GNAT family N-acetyltransferase [Methanosphaera stadtmanae]
MNKLIKEYQKINDNIKLFRIVNNKKKLYKILTKKIVEVLYTNKTDTYLIISKTNKAIGFFSIKETKIYNNKLAIELICLYILKEYRLKYIATDLLNDIKRSIKQNNNDYEYFLANSYVESAMFFLKNGFDFYHVDKGLNHKERNIILMYKKIK